MATQLTTRVSDEEIRSFVQPSRVHRRVYADADVFDLEMERIFERTWVYAAHESEVAEVGDYVRARIGRREVIVVRSDGDAIAGFFNRCPHRGSMICNVRRGHVSTFDCPYHGWSFARDGKLLGVPLPRGYPDDFDVEDPQNSLEPVARISSYRGFIFINLCADSPTLEDYIAPVRDSIDNIVDRAPDGGLMREGGEFRQIYYGNWKVHIENTFDFIHGHFLHRSSWGAVKDWEHDVEPDDTPHMAQQMKANGRSLNTWDDVGLCGFSGGHAYIGGFYNEDKIAPERSDPTFTAYRKLLVERHGEAKTAGILKIDRFNTLVYPNLILNNRFQQIRQFEPVAVDQTLLRSFCFRLKGAPEEMLHSAVRFMMSQNSPASMISQDDHEAFKNLQTAVSPRDWNGRASDWMDISRGYGHETRRNDGAVQGVGSSEVGIRNQLAAWSRYMTGELPRGAGAP